MARVDMAANFSARKYSRSALAGRVAWSLVLPLFRFSPRLCWGWRNGLLRLFGARVGRGVRVHPSVRILIPWTLQIGNQTVVGERAILYALGMVRIGERCTISQGAHLCGGTHDWRDPTMPLVKAGITIGDEVWVAAEAFVGPGTRIGDGAILGARAVAMRDVAEDRIVAGNPAREIGRREPTQDTGAKEKGAP